MSTQPTPIGVVYNNPLDMRPVQPPFEGSSGTITTTAGEFIKFTSAVWGFRAACRNLIAYYDGRLGEKINTVRGIISHWAPSTENNTEAYIDAVCKRTGYTPDQPLETKTYEVAYNLLHAMTIQEQGSFDDYFKEWELTDGIRRAGVSDVPPTPLHKRITAIGGAISGGSVVAAAVGASIQQSVTSVESVAAPAHIDWLGVPLAILVLIGAALTIYGSFSLARRQGV